MEVSCRGDRGVSVGVRAPDCFIRLGTLFVRGFNEEGVNDAGSMNLIIGVGAARSVGVKTKWKDKVPAGQLLDQRQPIFTHFCRRP